MGMKYNILLSHKFDRDFSRLERTLQDRVVDGLRELKENPHAGKQLKGKLKDLWSWRIGKGGREQAQLGALFNVSYIYLDLPLIIILDICSIALFNASFASFILLRYSF